MSDQMERDLRVLLDLIVDSSHDLQDENERLKDENAKLREQLDTAEHNRKRNFREYARLCHENDNLRELVRDMWPHMRHRSRMCRECELPCDASDECLLYEPMRQRMRGLGIEVEE